MSDSSSNYLAISKVETAKNANYRSFPLSIDVTPSPPKQMSHWLTFNKGYFPVAVYNSKPDNSEDPLVMKSNSGMVVQSIGQLEYKIEVYSEAELPTGPRQYCTESDCPSLGTADYSYTTKAVATKGIYWLSTLSVHVSGLLRVTLSLVGGRVTVPSLVVDIPCIAPPGTEKPSKKSAKNEDLVDELDDDNLFSDEEIYGTGLTPKVSEATNTADTANAKETSLETQKTQSKPLKRKTPLPEPEAKSPRKASESNEIENADIRNRRSRSKEVEAVSSPIAAIQGKRYLVFSPEACAAALRDPTLLSSMEETAEAEAFGVVKIVPFEPMQGQPQGYPSKQQIDYRQRFERLLNGDVQVSALMQKAEVSNDSLVVKGQDLTLTLPDVLAVVLHDDKSLVEYHVAQHRELVDLRQALILNNTDNGKGNEKKASKKKNDNANESNEIEVSGAYDEDMESYVNSDNVCVQIQHLDSKSCSPSINELLMRVKHRLESHISDIDMYIQTLQQLFEYFCTSTLMYPGEREMMEFFFRDVESKRIKYCDILGAPYLLRLLIFITVGVAASQSEEDPTSLPTGESSASSDTMASQHTNDGDEVTSPKSNSQRRRSSVSLKALRSHLTKMQDVLDAIVNDLYEQAHFLF